MKKILTLMLSLFLVVTLCICVGCTNKERLVIKESDTFIVITVSKDQMQITSNSTLVDYMESLKDDGKLDFEISGGMVSSVNGIENPTDWSSCWMLYTDDIGNANYAWGEIEFNGKVYGSSIFGAEMLKIKDGCVYIWVYQSFN